MANEWLRQGYFPNQPPIKPPRRAFPWRWIATAVVLIAIIAAGIVFVPRLLSSATGTATSAAWDASDLQGTWIGNDGNSDMMSAVVEGEHITINWDDFSGTTALYWQGSFAVPSGSEKEKTVISKADQTDALNLLAAQSDEKQFTVQKNRIVYTYTALGITRTVTMRKR